MEEVFVRRDYCSSLGRRSPHRLFIQRFHSRHIEDPCLDPSGLQTLMCYQGCPYQHPIGDDREIGSLPEEGRLTELEVGRRLAIDQGSLRAPRPNIYRPLMTVGSLDCRTSLMLVRGNTRSEERRVGKE